MFDPPPRRTVRSSARAWRLALGAAVALSGLAGAAGGLTWPANHGGPERRSWTPSTGTITTPAERWRMPVGGPAPVSLLLDADFDGTTELVFIAGGRLRAARLDGTTLWLTPPLALTALHGVADLDGNGAPELIAAGNDRLVIVALGTGQVLGTSPESLVHEIGFVRIADVDDDGDDEVLLASTGGVLSGYVMPTWTLDREGVALEIVAQTSHPHPGVEPHNTLGQDLVDTDGDGRPELLLPAPDRLHLYDLQTGQPIAASAPFERIGCRWVRTVPAKQGAPRILCWGDRVLGNVERLRGLRVFERAGDKLLERWSVLVQDDQKDRFHMPRSAVLDIDADGDLDAVYAIWGGESWRTSARDIESGALLFDPDSAPALAGRRIEHARAAGEGLGHATLLLAATDSEVPAAVRAWSRLTVKTPAGGPAPSLEFHPLGNALGVSILPGWGAATPDGALPAAPVLWLDRDGNGDGVLDGHEVVALADGTSLASWAASDGDVVLGPAEFGVSMRGALLFRAGGHVAARGVDGALMNDADDDGAGDLAVSTGGSAVARVVVGPSGAPRIVLAGAAGVSVLDPATADVATPPTVLWQSGRDPYGPTAALADLDGDGAPELVLRGRRPTVWLESRELDGALRWRFERAEGAWRWSIKPEEAPLLTDVNGDGADDVVVRITPVDGIAKGSGLPRWIALDGPTGASLWPAGAPCGALGQGGMSRAPEGLFLTEYHRRFVCDPATGALLEQAELFKGTYGVPAVWPGQGPAGKTLVTLGGGSNAVNAQALGPITELWSEPAKTLRGPTATALLDSGVALFVSDEDLSLVQAHDALTGAPLWSASYAQGQRASAAAAQPFGLVGMVATGDLSGDGAPDLVFGHEDGRVYLVDAAGGDIHWSHDLGGTTGAPVPADIDGDGALEVLVAAPDGYLHALDEPGLLPPAWVRENAGDGLALSAADDLDEQDDASTIHANWAPVLGANRYLVSVRTADGGLIDGPRDVGDATAAALSGLVLQLGVTYEVEVAASDSETGETSSPQRSDGLVIVDAEAPTIEAFAAAPAVVPALGLQTALSAMLRDNTRLDRWRITIRRSGAQGAPVRTLGAPLATTHHALETTWDLHDEAGLPVEPGAWVARLEVTDQAGLTATASRTLYVCAQPTVETSPACAGGLRPGGVVDPQGGNLPTVGTEARQRGAAACGVAAPAAAGPPGVLVALLGAVALALFARRRQHGPAQIHRRCTPRR